MGRVSKEHTRRKITARKLENEQLVDLLPADQASHKCARCIFQEKRQSLDT
jgi:hypothetical protein